MSLKKLLNKLYHYITKENHISFFRKIDEVIRKIGGRFYTKTLGQLKYKLRYEEALNTVVTENPDHSTFSDLCWDYEKEVCCFSNPLVSIIVPNFNHSQFLCERLDSIYNQTYTNFEVILLDDCSTDNSRDILMKYANQHSDNTRTIFNTTNSGRVFEQWNKGISSANGELIWIAESDDYCELNFLEKMVGLFCYSSVKLAFARSIFMQDGKQIWSTEEYLHDLENLKWEKPFYMSAHDLVQNGFAIHNIIPNVSSVVFKNVGQITPEVKQICQDMQLSGDWIFYLNMIKGGVVAYTNETTNYYRIHPQSTSLRIQKTGYYYSEFEQVSCYIARNFKISDETYQTILDNLIIHHNTQQEDSEEFNVADYYSIPKILKEKKKRLPNIVMACYALKSGGGETYPIFLANELKRLGHCVTLVNFDFEETENRILDLIERDVPVVTIKHTDFIWQILHHLGADIIHSHHASVDYALALWINSDPSLGKHIITLHGMYESITTEDCNRVIKETFKSCFKYVYIADKNLECFKQIKKYSDEKFIKLPNGLPVMEINAIDREQLHIGKDDFVLVLASRGIPEKGWKEAIEAVKIANQHGSRKVQLVILGDGDCRVKLEKDSPDFIHFVGTVSNVRDYFRMGDAGILPSRFLGESYPLVIIECLMTERPVIATDIAEVSNQIKDEDGKKAGILVPLHNWQIDINELADAMIMLANDTDLYSRLKSNALSACEKNDIRKITKQYLCLYENAMKIGS